MPGPFLSFNDSCRELLVTWVPSSVHQAFPEEYLRAELRHNYYIANYTNTLEEFELMICNRISRFVAWCANRTARQSL
jgi:hypothetical protein